MPGLHFIKNFKSPLEKNKYKIKTSVRSIIHEDNYDIIPILDETQIFLCASKYPQYKIKVLKNEKFTICLEGTIYSSNTENLNNELLAISYLITDEGNRYKKKVKEWLRLTDGEFIIFIKDNKNGCNYLINDYRGLLPCYYFIDANKFIFSREIRFILNLIDVKYDRYNMSQYLMLNYVLRYKTIFKGVFRFPAGSIFKISKDYDSVKLVRLCKYNFENQAFKKKNMEQCIEGLIYFFEKGCESRIKQYGHENLVLGLSGGRDSRAVCNGLLHTKTKFCTISFYYKQNRKTNEDLRIAKKFAQEFGVKWLKINIDAPTGEDVLKILKLKSSLNGLGFAFMIRFLKEMQIKFGNTITYITGDTGMSLRAYLPSKKLKNMDDLIGYIFNHDARMDVKNIGKILNLKAEKIIENFRADMECFEEIDFNRKYTNFCMYGRGFMWHHEGMDRNRCCCTLITPLEAQPFVDFAMNCPQELKRGYKLFDAFLGKLSKVNNQIELAEYNAPAKSLRAKIKKNSREIYNNFSINTKRIIKTYLIRNWSSYSPNSVPVRCLNDIFTNCKVVHDYLIQKEIKKLIKWCSKDQLNNILSLAACIEDYACDENSIEKYLQQKFE